LWWGHRIPAYSVIHGDGKDNDSDCDIFSTNSTTWIIARSEKEARSRAQEKYGDTVNLRQDPDVLDTWFSSTIVPFATLGWPENVGLYTHTHKHTHTHTHIHLYINILLNVIL